MSTLLSGENLAKEIRAVVKEEVEVLKNKFRITPTLAAIFVGSCEESKLYIEFQKKVTQKLGIGYQVLNFSKKIDESELVDIIEELNNDEKIHGIILQLPLPRPLNSKRVISAIKPEKDVEGVHPENLGRILWEDERIVPCTAAAVMRLLAQTNQDLYGKETVIVGHSEVVGKPLAMLLLNKMATVTVCHLATTEKRKLEDHVRRAEVLIVAVGKKDLIPGTWIREKATVIDVGINYDGGKVSGDVEFETAAEKAAYITPVPGGVGPVTVALLMRNLVSATKFQYKIKQEETEN